MKTKFANIIRSILLILILVISCTEENNSTTPNNIIEEGDHFEYLLYDNLSDSDISAVSENLENNFQRIISDLGRENLPTIKVGIWQNYTNFLNAMENDIGTRYQGATGYVMSDREFRIYFNNDAPTAAVHEFAHVVSIHVNSTIPNNPRWLWEAVALYENQEFVDPGTLSYMLTGNYPSIEELNSDYNSGTKIYSVGYVLMEYIVESWGRDKMIELILYNGNIQRVLDKTVSEFESGWHQFIESKYLTK